MVNSFKVVYPKRVLEAFRNLYQTAEIIGMIEALVEAAETIDYRLQKDPREFGDPCYSLPQLHLDLFVRAVSPLVVWYGVHRTKNVVFVKKIEALPGLGLLEY
jgi:hypothetical protein